MGPKWPNDAFSCLFCLHFSWPSGSHVPRDHGLLSGLNSLQKTREIGSCPRCWKLWLLSLCGLLVGPQSGSVPRCSANSKSKPSTAAPWQQHTHSGAKYQKPAKIWLKKNCEICRNHRQQFFLTFLACFSIPIIFSNLNQDFSNFLDMRNLQEQVKKAFFYQKLFWPFTVWINCSSDLKHFTNSQPSVLNFKSFSRSLEQNFLTVGQNNFGNNITFLHCRCYYCGLEVKIAQLFFYFFQVWKNPALRRW